MPSSEAADAAAAASAATATHKHQNASLLGNLQQQHRHHLSKPSSPFQIVNHTSPAIISSIIDSFHTIDLPSHIPDRSPFETLGPAHHISATHLEGRQFSNSPDLVSRPSVIEHDSPGNNNPILSAAPATHVSQSFTAVDSPGFIRRAPSILKRFVRPVSITAFRVSHRSFSPEGPVLDSSLDPFYTHDSSSPPSGHVVSSAALTSESTCAKASSVFKPCLDLAERPRSTIAAASILPAIAAAKRRPVSHVIAHSAASPEEYVRSTPTPPTSHTQRSRVTLDLDGHLAATTTAPQDNPPIVDDWATADVIPKRVSSIGKPSKQSLRAFDAATRMCHDRLRRRASKTALTSRAPRRKPVMSDLVFEELGEDDETVKRIRELKQQRASRTLYVSTTIGLPNTTTTSNVESLDPETLTLVPGYFRPTLVDDNSAIDDGTRPATLAPQVLGIDCTAQRTDLDNVDAISLSGQSGPLPVDNASNPHENIATDHVRPQTSDSKRRSSFSFSLARASSALGRPRGLERPRSPCHADASKRRTDDKYASDATSRHKISYTDVSMPFVDVSTDLGRKIDRYMKHPRLNQRVSCLRSGRTISFSEVGDPDGNVIMVCSGMGLSRFVSVFYDDLASSLKLRLITPERPGVGDSDSYSDGETSSPLAWHQDILSICRHLKVTRFSLLGHSAGAIYALSTALALPTFVQGSIQLLAPWIPHSQFSDDSSIILDERKDLIVGSLPRSQRLLRVLPVSVLRAANANFLGFNTGSMLPPNKRANDRRKSSSPSPGGRFESLEWKDPLSMLSSSSSPQLADSPSWKGNATRADTPCDDEPLQLSATASPVDMEFTLASESLSAAEHMSKSEEAAYNSLLVQRVWELATMNTNPAVDLLVCLEKERGVGFCYADVQQRIVITHGEQDNRVPVENVRWLAGRLNRREPITPVSATSGNEPLMPECLLRVLPDEGHGLMANAVVMTRVLKDIAEEWIRSPAVRS